MEIDLKMLKKSGLYLEEFVTLALINEGVDLEEYLDAIDMIVVKDLENELWIKRIDSGYELRGKARELFESKKEGITFEEFWNKYHTITYLPKTDKDAAEKYWKRLKINEKEKAVANIQPYYDSLNDKKYCRKARTYLENKNFNDEFKTNRYDSTDIFTIKGTN